MQTWPAAVLRCKIRRVRPRMLSSSQLGLWMATATAVVWSTAACCTTSGARPENPFVGNADREQPRYADASGALLRQPTTLVASRQSQAAAQRLAAKWQTSLMVLGADEVGEIFAQKNDLPNPDAQAGTLTGADNLLGAEGENGDDSASPAEEEAISCYVAPPLSAVRTNISLPAGKLPDNAFAKCAEQMPPANDTRLAGGWAMMGYHWSATCFHHRPLYFEEINAERYGYTPSYLFQPLISAGRFFATIPALPYKMTLDCPRDCVYSLGHYRPGSCNPRRPQRLPLRIGASVMQAGAIAGLILIFP